MKDWIYFSRQPNIYLPRRVYHIEDGGVHHLVLVELNPQLLAQMPFDWTAVERTRHM